MTTTPAPTTDLTVDPAALRASVRDKYKEVALRPDGDFHFHTGRRLAALLGYHPDLVDHLPDRAVESFAGVANPFSVHPVGQEDRLVDIGSGGGFDAFVAAQLVGERGRVVGVDMTTEMLDKARVTAAQLGLDHVGFREGIAEELPVDDGWADVVIANGVLNLVADKRGVFAEIHRVLRPGGRLQFADITVSGDVPAEAACDIDLWTDCIAGGLSPDDWCDVVRGAGFVDVEMGPAVDAFGGAPGERNARRFDVYAHAFSARRPA
ncbi:MAG: methyltransferase domain-containing protein [Actinobacteria bacterium]|nr:methyltransferase domain-containing protein [Actinomycetota bacterium]